MLRSPTASLLSLALASVSAFVLPPPLEKSHLSRRDAIVGTAAGVASVLASPLPAVASGGATAGKTTSIPRAKVRYYGRMTEVIIAYDALGAAIKSGDGIKDAAKKFFAESDTSPISEMSSAGYLLSVAFKIDGKIPPEKIAQVKDHKKMMKELKSLQSACKESAAKAQAAYASASSSVNTWLDGVDLPALGDKAYDPRSLPVCSNPATGPCIRESLADAA